MVTRPTARNLLLLATVVPLLIVLGGAVFLPSLGHLAHPLGPFAGAYPAFVMLLGLGLGAGLRMLGQSRTLTVFALGLTLVPWLLCHSLAIEHGVSLVEAIITGLEIVVVLVMAASFLVSSAQLLVAFVPAVALSAFRYITVPAWTGEFSRYEWLELQAFISLLTLWTLGATVLLITYLWSSEVGTSGE